MPRVCLRSLHPSSWSPEFSEGRPMRKASTSLQIRIVAAQGNARSSRDCGGRPVGHALVNDVDRRLPFVADELEPGRPYALRTASDFLLHELDQLDELRNRIQTKQRQKP